MAQLTSLLLLTPASAHAQTSINYANGNCNNVGGSNNTIICNIVIVNQRELVRKPSKPKEISQQSSRDTPVKYNIFNGKTVIYSYGVTSFQCFSWEPECRKSYLGKVIQYAYFDGSGKVFLYSPATPGQDSSHAIGKPEHYSRDRQDSITNIEVNNGSFIFSQYYPGTKIKYVTAISATSDWCSVDYHMLPQKKTPNLRLYSVASDRECQIRDGRRTP